MCGIAGTLDLEPGLEPCDGLVAQMTDLLSHRGPDDAGLLVDGPAVLGARRLSILDLSPAGHQPMGTEDGRFWITFNGEIYNYRELASDLRARGHRFVGGSDTEVLLAAVQLWGPAALSRLNGIFAFAVWDRQQRQLFCARDRFGVKPFYYTIAGGRFRFASEIKALLLDPAVPRVPNDARVLDFLAYGFTDHTAETLFAGIRQLPAGGYLFASPDSGVGHPVSWYELSPADLNGGTPAQELRELLEDAVALRLRSDVPVGTTLSGGLDSSTVTALATLLRRREGLEPADTFSSRCTDPRIDEGRYMEPVLRLTGARNHDFTPREADLHENLDRVLWHMDEPFHSAAVYGHWKLSALARTSGVTVLLDGQGGDEALAGYDYLLYPGFFYTLLSRGRLPLALREVRARQDVLGASVGRSLKDVVKLLLPAGRRAPRTPRWLNGGLSLSAPPLPGSTLLDHHRYGLLVQPLAMYNHQLDRNTMSVSLEARNPFLDYRVVECGLALRPEEHVRGGFTKWTLREAVRDLLPAEVVDRPRKQGFSTDEAEWMRGALGETLEEAFGSESLASRPYFVPGELRAALAAHRAGQNRSPELWRAFIVERWLRLLVDPSRIEAPEPSYATPRSDSFASAKRLELPLADRPVVR